MLSDILLMDTKHTNILTIYHVKGLLHLLPQKSMFCALSQNNQQLFEK